MTDWADEKAREWLEQSFGTPYPGEGGYAPSIVKSLAALLREVQQQERERITGIVRQVNGDGAVGDLDVCHEILRRIEEMK